MHLTEERTLLLPHGIKLDAGLEKQVESLVAADACGGDEDLVAAQNKV